MRPVTELLALTSLIWEGQGATPAEWADLARRLERLEGQPALLEVLDLVATLPPERLGLVRWVVGLGEEEQALLGQALANQQELVDEWAPEEAEDIRRFVAMREGFAAALSGGEGGAKAERRGLRVIEGGKTK